VTAAKVPDTANTTVRRRLPMCTTMPCGNGAEFTGLRTRQSF
jgi:hypothetical protein